METKYALYSPTLKSYISLKGDSYTLSKFDFQTWKTNTGAYNARDRLEKIAPASAHILMTVDVVGVGF